MGSWNATCGISNLPIQCGEKCKLIFLVENIGGLSVSAGFCSPSDLRYVLSLPIDVEYNDYGSVENVVKTEYTEFFIDSLNKKIKSKEIKITEENKDFSFSTIEDVCDLIFEERAKIKEELPLFINGKRRYCTLSYMFIKSDVYDSSIEIIKNDPIVYSVNIDRSKKDAIETYDLIVGKKYQDEHILKLKLASLLFLLDSGSTAECGLKVLDYARHCLENKELFCKLIDSVIEFRMLYLFMYYTRKLFIEGCGKGSQTLALDIYEKHFEKMLEVTKKLNE